MKRPEDVLQKSVVDHLELIERIEPGFWFCAIPNAGKRSYKTAAREKAMGLRAGAPDIHFCWNGRAHYIELKAPGSIVGKRKVKDHRSEAQKAVHTRITIAGGAVVTLDSWDNVRGFLDCCGVPRLSNLVAE